MFVSRGALEPKLARARQWEALPRRPGEREHFGHSTDAAIQSHTLVTDALAARASHPASPNASDRRNARIFVTARPEFGEPAAGAVNAGEYCVTTDPARARPGGPTISSEGQLIVDRSEGRYLASAATRHHWFAISKVILTVFTARGIDISLTDVPGDAMEVLRLDVSRDRHVARVIVIAQPAARTALR